jgi:hypothetical protein
MISRAFFLPIVLAAAVLVACGGDKNANGSSSPPAAVLDEIDLAGSVQSIQQLKSFRFDLTMKMDASGGGAGDPLAAAFLGALGNIKANGAVVAPDQTEMHMTIFGQQFSYIQIGNRAWEKTGSTWEPATAGDLTFDMDFEDLITDFVPEQVLKTAKTSKEKVNGVDAIRYSFDKAALEQIARDLGEAADFTDVDSVGLDIWLNADNIPVKLVIAASGRGEGGQKFSLSMEMNITDINDPSVKIKPPV